MAVFCEALAQTLAYETDGGRILWLHDPRDPGAETAFGVSRRWHPEWPGWSIIDAAKGQPDFPESLRGHAGLAAEVRQLYNAVYWTPHHLGAIPSQAIAWQVFDSAVNPGSAPERAIPWLQGALNALRHGQRPLKVDGQLGPKTLAASALSDPLDRETVARLLRAQRAAWYLDRATADPEQRIWIRGWIRRAMAERWAEG